MIGQRRGGSFLVFFIYLIFGAYFINYALNFIPIPSAIDPLNKWIIFVGGILVIFGAVNHFKLSRYKYPYSY